MGEHDDSADNPGRTVSWVTESVLKNDHVECINHNHVEKCGTACKQQVMVDGVMHFLDTVDN